MKITKFNKNNNRGFTIIEVLIVLAIAGLILLIVFLAVPALQRNQRNTSRNNEASRVSAAVTECLANRNGVIASCDALAKVNVGTLKEFDGAPSVNFQKLPGGAAPASGLTSAGVWYGRKCLIDGSGVDPVVTGVSKREFVVLFTTEPAITRCIT